jgi:hypothetical protein
MEDKIDELKEEMEELRDELKEKDTYQLISINLTEKEDKFTGILNCRVNGEHKQIRF